MEQNPEISFREYKTKISKAIRLVLVDEPGGFGDEAAFPAYAHLNPFINWFFWQRLHIVIKSINQNKPYENILDFGCGGGIFLPLLAKYSPHVLGLDIDLEPYEKMKKYISFPPHVEVRNCRKYPLEEYPNASFDLITALDVLEHVNDLSTTLNQLMRLLKPGGCLIISGPTENILYRVGRKLAGKEFTGAYHERDVTEIALLASQKGNINMLSLFFLPLPLFKIFIVKKAWTGS